MKNSLCFVEEELAGLKRAGISPGPKILSTPQGPKARFEDKEVINLSSNNYLGLTTHPKLKEAAKKAIEQFGTGSGAARNIAGFMTLHKELEDKLAAFKGTEASIVFQTGFSANAGTVSTIIGKEDIIVSDRLNHGSIIDGCRLARAGIKIFSHKDVKEAEKLLKESKGARRILLITDGVFSMDGDIAPLPGLVALANKYKAIMMVDDAHAFGVLGRNGRGTVDHFNLCGQVDIQMGTFSKAIGSFGGYVAGSRALIDYLACKARPILFSTSLPPASIACASAALDILKEQPELIDKLWENTRFFKDSLFKLGFNTGISETPIIPIVVGEEEKAIKSSKRLFQEGVFARAITYPAVPKGEARLRTIISAAHTKEDLTFALNAFEKIGKELRR
ncbi:glycine C-acetyltransferase [bacterium]|nr:glycine C-acetyltransferase [bacterium]